MNSMAMYTHMRYVYIYAYYALLWHRISAIKESSIQMRWGVSGCACALEFAHAGLGIHGTKPRECFAGLI